MSNNSEYLVAFKIPFKVGSPLYKTEIEFFYRTLMAAERRAESIDKIGFVKRNSTKVVRYLKGSVIPGIDGYDAKFPLPDGSYKSMSVDYYISTYCE